MKEEVCSILSLINNTGIMEVDLSLLNAARRMDQKALAAIFDRYAAALYSYAVQMCGDPLEADHTVGEVFTKFLEQLAAGKEPHTNLRAHLYQMAHHRIVDGSRLSRRAAPLDVAEFEPDKDDGHHSMDSSLQNKILMASLIPAINDHLTANQRDVIVLRFVEGFSLPETAQIVGKDVDSIKVIENGAIAKLRAVLSKGGA